MTYYCLENRETSQRNVVATLVEEEVEVQEVKNVTEIVEALVMKKLFFKQEKEAIEITQSIALF